MPKQLEDRRKAIQKGNPSLPKDRAYAIATASLQKQGRMPKAKGKKK